MTAFAWNSMLGAAVALVLAAGAFHVFIGAMTPVMTQWRAGWNPGIVVYDRAADEAVFGKPPDALLADPDVRALREIAFGLLSGTLVALGVLEIALAWFGLRTGQGWVLGALAIAAVLSAAFWTFGHALWIRAGMPSGLGALQPFQWVPLALTIPALAVGWWALR